jgi:hypothetical protein
MLQYLKDWFFYVFYTLPSATMQEIDVVFKEHRAAPRRRRQKKSGRRSRRHKK